MLCTERAVMEQLSNTRTVGASCKYMHDSFNMSCIYCPIRYSGDTIPTQKLVQAGENATLLIHESTMADDQAEMAAAKMHSTVGQAIDIGRRYGYFFAVKAALLTLVHRMKARNILLTHFSARYPNIPPSVETEHNPGDPTLALAFDHANIKIGEMWKMNAYIKAIEQSFTDLEDENDVIQMEEVDDADLA